MRIGIDCDGVLREFIESLKDAIEYYHPEFKNKILPCESWTWTDWLPFWTNEQTENFVFKERCELLFGPSIPPYTAAYNDWPKLKEWAKENNHELVLVSSQREQCRDLTTKWLDRWEFDFDEIHYTKDKHLVDVDVLIDDSPAKLFTFKKKSINNGSPICMKRPWNKECWDKMMSINRLEEIVFRLFG